MWTEMPIRRDCDIARTLELCDMLTDSDPPRGKTLGQEIMAQVRSRYIKRETYERLSSWAHPERRERSAQPVAENLSYELFGFIISRIED